MRLKPYAVSVVLAALAVGVSASAASAATQAANVERIAGAQPQATTPAQAEANQRNLGPAVKQALQQGEGPALAQSKSPDVLGALLRSSGVQASEQGEAAGYHVAVKAPPKGDVKAVIARRGVRAHAAGCWGSISDTYNIWAPGGLKIGWIYVRNNGWCGDGYRISWYGGPTYADWAWGPYCWTSKGSDYSWDGYPTWIHSAHWGSLGVSYPWGCGGLKGGKAVVRFAANGYWDTYNDYGF